VGGNGRPSGRSYGRWAAPQPTKPKKRRERGDDGISWDKINKCYVGTVSLGYDEPRQARSAVPCAARPSRGQGQARQAARGDQAASAHRRPTPSAVRQGLARLARARSAHHGHLPRPGREVDLSEDRRDEAQGLQGHRRRPVLPGDRQGAQQALADDDQEHAPPVDPPSPEVRPHRPERRRARRPARRAARAPVAGHDRGAGRQGAQDRERPGDRLRQGREGGQGKYARPTRPPRPASWRAAPRPRKNAKSPR
jgi:hypothetical protein